MAKILSLLSQVWGFLSFVFQVLVVCMVGFFYRVVTPPALLLVVTLDAWAEVGVYLPTILGLVVRRLVVYVGLCSFLALVGAAIGGPTTFGLVVFLSLYGSPLVGVVLCCLAVGEALERADIGGDL